MDQKIEIVVPVRIAKGIAKWAEEQASPETNNPVLRQQLAALAAQIDLAVLAGETPRGHKPPSFCPPEVDAEWAEQDRWVATPSNQDRWQPVREWLDAHKAKLGVRPKGRDEIEMG